jgi:hypothetical protein
MRSRMVVVPWWAGGAEALDFFQRGAEQSFGVSGRV